MKKYLFFSLLVAITIIAIVSCKQSKKVQATDALVSHIDSTIKAGDDFFLFANGKWFRQNPIPASEQSNGIFQLIQDTSNQRCSQREQQAEDRRFLLYRHGQYNT